MNLPANRKHTMNRSLKISIYLLIAACVTADFPFFVRWPLGALLTIPVIPLLFVGSILFLIGLINQIKKKQFPFQGFRIHLSTVIILLLVLTFLAWKNTQPQWWYATGTDIVVFRGEDYRVASYGWPFDMRRIEYGTIYEGDFRIPKAFEKSIPIPGLPLDIYVNILHWIFILAAILIVWERGLSYWRNRD